MRRAPLPRRLVRRASWKKALTPSLSGGPITEAFPLRGRENRQSRSERSGRVSTQAHIPAVAPAWRRETAASKRPDRPNSPRADEKRRQRPNDYDMARSTPTAPPQQKAKVDPNSPFAKLLELRSLLEEQANKRQ